MRARAAVIGLLQMTTMAPHAVHATLQAENKYRVIQCQGGGKKGVPSDQVRLIYLGFLSRSEGYIKAKHVQRNLLMAQKKTLFSVVQKRGPEQPASTHHRRDDKYFFTEGCRVME